MSKKITKSKIYLIPSEYHELIRMDAVDINGRPHLRFKVGNYPPDNDPLSPWGGYTRFEEYEYELHVPVSPNGSFVEIPPEIWNLDWNYPVGLYTRQGYLIPVDVLIEVKTSA